jgi:hypothetical protein
MNGFSDAGSIPAASTKIKAILQGVKHHLQHSLYFLKQENIYYPAG